jgi:hypothetical protein
VSTGVGRLDSQLQLGAFVITSQILRCITAGSGKSAVVVGQLGWSQIIVGLSPTRNPDVNSW